MFNYQLQLKGKQREITRKAPLQEISCENGVKKEGTQRSFQGSRSALRRGSALTVAPSQAGGLDAAGRTLAVYYSLKRLLMLLRLARA